MIPLFYQVPHFLQRKRILREKPGRTPQMRWLIPLRGGCSGEVSPSLGSPEFWVPVPGPPLVYKADRTVAVFTQVSTDDRR